MLLAMFEMANAGNATIVTVPSPANVGTVAGLTVVFSLLVIFGIVLLCWTVRSRKVVPEPDEVTSDDKNKWKALFDKVLVRKSRAMTMIYVEVNPELIDFSLISSVAAEEQRSRREIIQLQCGTFDSLRLGFGHRCQSTANLLVTEEHSVRAHCIEDETVLFDEILSSEEKQWNVLVMHELTKQVSHHRDTTVL